MNSFPLVSVIIPTLNRSSMLHKAIESVIGQIYENIEIIVIDDFSDMEIDLSSLEFKNRTLKIQRNEKRSGGAYSRYRGTELASGDYICFLDDDDQYLENKISDLVYELEKNDSVDAVFGKIIRTDNKLSNKKMDRLDGKLLKNIWALPFLHTNTSLIRKRAFKAVNFEPALKKYQDTQFHIELIIKLTVLYINKPVAIWNVSHSGEQITDIKNEEDAISDIFKFNSMYHYIRNSCKLNVLNFVYLECACASKYYKHKRFSSILTNIHSLNLKQRAFYLLVSLRNTFR